MRWDTAVPAWLDRLRNDTGAKAALGGTVPVDAGGMGEVATIPGYAWFMVAETTSDASERPLIQLDIQAPTQALGVVMERRARATLAFAIQLVAGISIGATLVDVRTIGESACWHRQLDFRLALVRGA